MKRAAFAPSLARIGASSLARCRAIACGGALALAACGGDGGSSSPTPPPPPPPIDPQVRITGFSPYAPGCDLVAPIGTLYVNAEVEPHVSVNPSNPNHLLAAWQQDRWSNGAARGTRSAVSFDGGRTWTASAATFSRCGGGTAVNGGDYERASDPWTAIGPDGTAYQIAIATTGVSQTPGSAGAVLVSRSPDGGLTWETPVTLIRDVDLVFNDKESMAADPTDARLVYAIWDRLSGSRGPTLFTRSTDTGMNWETARTIYDPGPNNQTINNQVVVLPDGTLVAYFTEFIRNATATLRVIRSSDKGVTWSAPITIATVQARGAIDPESGTAIRDGATLGSISAGRNGQLAAVWQDARFSSGQRDGVALSRSFDGGLTWTAPVQLNRVPAVQAFLPAVHIRDDGTIGVTYYDLRSNTNAPTLLADFWLVQSTDGVTWRESRLADTFDYGTAPFARGLFLGDYTGLVSSGTTFIPVYGLTTGNLVDRADIFASLASTVGAAAAAQADATFVASAPTDALPVTPELATTIAASVQRAIERRALAGRQADPPAR
ncbi:MAG: sialidase family protein [Betaproteobacteria bacterium]